MARQKDQTGFAIASVVLICILVPYTHYALKISEYGQAHVPAGYQFPDMMIFKKTAISTVVCMICSRCINYICYDYCYANAKVKTDHETKHRYAVKGTRYIYQSIYFTVATVWGWYVLKDTAWLPWYLGGQANGDFFAAAAQFNIEAPYLKYDEAILDYSAYTAGYHVSGFILHTFIQERHDDFAEMFMHHVATCTLYFGYIFANFMTGAVVAYLHDIADVPASICKYYTSRPTSTPLVAWFITVIVVWFLTRLMGLPLFIYSILEAYRMPDGDIKDFGQGYLYMIVVFLCALQFLHIFWWVKFILMICHFQKTGESVDVVEGNDSAGESAKQTPKKTN